MSTAHNPKRRKMKVKVLGPQFQVLAQGTVNARYRQEAFKMVCATIDIDQPIVGGTVDGESIELRDSHTHVNYFITMPSATKRLLLKLIPARSRWLFFDNAIREQWSADSGIDREHIDAALEAIETHQPIPKETKYVLPKLKDVYSKDPKEENGE